MPDSPTGSEPSTGKGTQSFAGTMAHVPLKIEIAKFKPLEDMLARMRKQVQGLTKDFNALAGSVGGAVGAAAGGGTSGTGGTSAGGTPKPAPFRTSSPVPPVLGGVPIPGAPPIPPGTPPAGAPPPGAPVRGFAGIRSYVARKPAAQAGLALAAVGAQVVGAMDRRIERGTEYASGADKLSVLTQQINNMSQRQVLNQRLPLTNYRIGPEGANQMLAFQASTGVQATGKMASSIAGLNAASGYAKGTAGVLADQRSMMDPQVANRMLMQLGTNAYTYGGKTKDPMQLQQDIVKAMGLTNDFVLKGASQMGSATRARLTNAGVAQDMQDDVINFAKENQTFKKRGGKGMYDPSKKEDRKLMGIEGNLATQQQETERMRNQREEKFMDRQIGNMTKAEQQNQTMIHILASIDGYLASAYGARSRVKNWANIAGKAMQVVGMGIAMTGAGAGPGLALAAAGTVVAGATSGGDGSVDDDRGGKGAAAAPPANTSAGSDGSIMVPYGYKGKTASLNTVKADSSFKTMNPKMQERLLSLMRAHPSTGFGGGVRSEAQQRAMFLDRYVKTEEKTDRFWEGSYWKKIKGFDAAPPGRSMHEIGLAADMVGDTAWLTQNAGRFGLKNFANVNNEPHHLQPVELPNSRRQYEEEGSVWGGPVGTTDTSTPPPAAAGAPLLADFLGDSGAAFKGTGGGGGGGALSTHAGMSMAETMSAVQAEAVASLGGKTGTGRRGGKTSTKANSALPSSVVVAGGKRSGKMSGEDVARMGYNVGWRGQDLVDAVAIAGRESHWNPNASNQNEGTGDHSYGLWQLNTFNNSNGQMGTLVTSILNEMGVQADGKNFDQLFDPEINAKVAHKFYERWGNTFGAWGAYKGKSNTFGTDGTAALEAVQGAFPNGYGGDPTPVGGYGGGGGGGSRGMVHVTSAPSIHVAPVINFYGTPNTPDLMRIATQVTQLLKDQARTVEMRNA